MKLSHGIGLLAAGLGSVGLLALTGAGATSLTACSSSSGSGGGSGSSSGGGSSASDLCANLAPTACITAPAPPKGGSATTVTKTHNYALSQLWLGDTDRMGNMDMNAWQNYGYNIDGLVTTAASTDVCTLQTGAQKSYQVDGTGGIDNSFGENIIPILQTLISTPTTTVNNAIMAGSFTIFTVVTGFDDSAGNKTTATGLNGALLAGAKFSADGGTAPDWSNSTTQAWPVLPDPGLINGCTAYPGGCPAGTDPVANAKIKFGSAFQTNGTFVNGTPATVQITLSISGQQLSLQVAAATISFDPEAPGSVTNGTIAGVLDTTQLLAGLQNVAGSFSSSLCAGSAWQSIASQISATSDIVLDSTGTQVSNPKGTMCNAISIGLGFNSKEFEVPTASDVAPASPPKPNPCADGG